MSADPFVLIRADIEEEVRLLAKGNGELQAAVWAGGANATRLAEKLAYDCDAVLAQLVEVEQAVEFISAAPHRFNLHPEELQARRAWISATRDAVRRTADHVAPHRPPVQPRPHPVAIGIPVTLPPPTTATSTSTRAPSPYSAASEPCCTAHASPPLSGSMRVSSAIAGAAHANAAYAASATVAAASSIAPVRTAAAAAHTAASFSAGAAHRAASTAVGAAHTAVAAGGAVLGGSSGFLSGQLQAQQRAMRHQDGLLDELDASLGRIANQGRRIGRELEEQTGMLGHLESGVDAAVSGLRGAHKRALGLLRGR
ncbi:hypothetical protein HXX76_011993 [Chlamydomonas incerta]|uniref:t-SNARE coiled-coil homology domain-containing protein n=1 Tax=Chlamydomonas incerta TaxID=51695 RepID=A0A835VSV1_CHLIN|nr:hypothetical protein HXX76_011993 [Chlamydomonas incerta]|eukprot:KAG2428007.1 hypothetical protein HXX76_011993 [Chlamydomonas incerta]